MNKTFHTLIKIIILSSITSYTSAMISFWGEENTILKTIANLIVGGQPANTNDIPYQAALYYREYYFCCGSIVSPTFIVSAAHCFLYFGKKTSGLTVRVGTDHSHSGGQVITVKMVLLHPKFSPWTVDYDVSVVEVSAPLRFTKTIKPIKLADSEPTEGQSVRVSGWGFLTEKGPLSPILQSVVLKIVARNLCEKMYKRHVRITKRMICACGEGKDACYGDSGAPLTSKDVLVGIVSMGRGCARLKSPGIYTSVSHPDIKNFIMEKTGI